MWRSGDEALACQPCTCTNTDTLFSPNHLNQYWILHQRHVSHQERSVLNEDQQRNSEHDLWRQSSTCKRLWLYIFMLSSSHGNFSDRTNCTEMLLSESQLLQGPVDQPLQDATTSDFTCYCQFCQAQNMLGSQAKHIFSIKQVWAQDSAFQHTKASSTRYLWGSASDDTK